MLQIIQAYWPWLAIAGSILTLDAVLTHKRAKKARAAYHARMLAVCSRQDPGWRNWPETLDLDATRSLPRE